MENSKKQFDIDKYFFSFPLFNGIFCIQKQNLVICTVSNKGIIHLKSQKLKKKFIKHSNTPFLRGIEFVLCSIFNYFTIIFHQYQNTDKKQKNVFIQYALTGLFFILAILIIWLFFLGWLPATIAFYIVPISCKAIIKNLCLGITKCLIFILLLIALSFIEEIKTIWKYNTAGNVVITDKKIRPLNIFNVITSTLLITFFMVSLLGLTCTFAVKILINLIIFTLAIAFSFEINLLLEKNDKKWHNTLCLGAFLTTRKPEKTEMQVANGAYNEGVLMQKSENRKIVDSFSEHHSLDLAFILSEVQESLKKNGITDFGEAEWLVANVLGCKKLDLRLIDTISKTEYKALQNALERRLQGEPIDKIFGFTEFFGLKFKVNKDVLTPRQETEILVETILKEIGKQKSSILDIGTGSGAIAISLAKNSSASVYAVDISENALEVAKENAKQNNVDVKFKQSNLFSKIKLKKFDIIVSNPPYIKTNDINSLEREVKYFDPIIALDGGSDGLYFYKKIIAESVKFLKPKGKIYLELGIGQASKVKKLLTENFDYIKIIKDYNGIQRIIYATKKD